MTFNRVMAVAALITSLAGCQPTPPSYVTNANTLLEKQISKISGEKTKCQYTRNSGFWLSACSFRSTHSVPLFALLEPEGIMQANDNLAIFVAPVNSDARHFSQQPGFTIPVTTRKIPVNIDEVIKSLPAASY
ncbi:hypothetical protein [Serratia proteamaculans]|uniref:hypothetical protein n=1 Tax=Serratia proteamaculans TaxID=28151 RepID=UPI00217AF604|nr:hypothetical protein [Serratia proteamaculans]CAI1592178.1 Uncharacterised protein [Serratia proteamaculans]